MKDCAVGGRFPYEDGWVRFLFRGVSPPRKRGALTGVESAGSRIKKKKEDKICGKIEKEELLLR